MSSVSLAERQRVANKYSAYVRDSIRGARLAYTDNISTHSAPPFGVLFVAFMQMAYVFAHQTGFGIRQIMYALNTEYARSSTSTQQTRIQTFANTLSIWLKKHIVITIFIFGNGTCLSSLSTESRTEYNRTKARTQRISAAFHLIGNNKYELVEYKSPPNPCGDHGDTLKCLGVFTRDAFDRMYAKLTALELAIIKNSESISATTQNFSALKKEDYAIVLPNNEAIKMCTNAKNIHEYAYGKLQELVKAPMADNENWITKAKTLKKEIATSIPNDTMYKKLINSFWLREILKLYPKQGDKVKATTLYKKLVTHRSTSDSVIDGYYTSTDASEQNREIEKLTKNIGTLHKQLSVAEEEHNIDTQKQIELQKELDLCKSQKRHVVRYMKINNPFGEDEDEAYFAGNKDADTRTEPNKETESMQRGVFGHIIKTMEQPAPPTTRPSAVSVDSVVSEGRMDQSTGRAVGYEKMLGDIQQGQQTKPTTASLIEEYDKENPQPRAPGLYLSMTDDLNVDRSMTGDNYFPVRYMPDNKSSRYGGADINANTQRDHLLEMLRKDNNTITQKSIIHRC